MRHSWFGRIAVAAALLGVSAFGLSAQVGSTSATVRGTVTDQSGSPVANAQVSVTNVSTGVTRGTLADENGQYILPFVEPGGPYQVSVQSVGFGAAQRDYERIGLGQVLVANFQLSTQAIALEGLEVNVESQPVIDTRQAGIVDRVNSIQIESLPTNGRNFADFVALAPGVQVGVGDGSGGNLSLGGGRRGATNITIDGVDNNGTFFGGEARGSDRIAFAYSIETVKEFQVITNGYDVEFGNFTGGQVNAITKSGTNEFKGNAFFYRRDDSLLGDDFNGQAPGTFTSNQFGATLSGPIIRDKAHFLVSFDRQERVNPVFSQGFGDFAQDITQAELQQFIDIMGSTYGYDASGEFGEFGQTNDQNAIFARVDWNLNDNNQLNVRWNFTDLFNENDRLSGNEGVSNAGNFENTANSLALNLKSVFGSNLFNDFRFQYSTERRPRPAYSTLPQLELQRFSEVDFFGTEIEIFNDPVLADNAIDEDLIQVVNNLQIQLGDHTVKIGTSNQFYDLVNRFAFNGLGEFEFEPRYGRSALENLALGAARQYTIGIPLTDDPLGVTEYGVSEHAIYAQDEWQVNDRLQLNFGLRWDYTRLPDSPPQNDAVLANFGIDNTGMPDDRNNFSPRVGFAYDVNGDGRSVVRGGAGLFYGRIPAVFWSNAYLNNGVTQSSVFCQGNYFDTPEVRQQVIEILSGQRETYSRCTDIPGASAANLPIADVNVVGDDVQLPGAWKFNLGYDTELFDGWRAGIDLSHTRISDNYYIAERNLRAPQFFIEGGRPVFVEPGQIDTGDGEPAFNRAGQFFRRDFAVDDLLQMTDQGESRTWSAVFELDRQFSNTWSAGASYALSRTSDNSSYSCCFHNTAITETPTSGGPNDLGDVGDARTGTWGPADFDRTHVLTVNAVYRDAFGLPGLQLSGFYRGQSGLPFTPIVGGDVNADGRGNNDRAYVGQDLLFETPQDAARMGFLIDEFDCLKEQEGRIATRNSCRNSWQHRVDARASFRLPTLTGQNVEFMADVFNVLNILNSDWGQFLTAGATESLTDLASFDPVQGRHVYSVNERFGEQRIAGFVPQQWQIQLGVRYNVN